jgi:rhamnosyltransferase
MGTDIGSDRAALAAIIPAFEPDMDRLRLVIDALAPQVGRIIVIDDGSPSTAIADGLESGPRIELLRLAANGGIAAALNAGVARLGDVAEWTWLLTLDQDTVIEDGAVDSILAELEQLPAVESDHCGILAMSRPRAPYPSAAKRWIERGAVIGEIGGFRRRRCVITSGNLVRREVLAKVPFDERLFMDQVDWKFCADVRRAGWSVLELKRPTMDHQLGRAVVVGGRAKVFESGRRLYYVTRNGMYLALRRDFALRLFARDVAGLSRVYIAISGIGSVPHCTRILLTAGFDALTGRLGRRDYRFLAAGA